MKAVISVASYLGPVGSYGVVMSSLEASLLLCFPVAAADPDECRAFLFDWIGGVKDGHEKGKREGGQVYVNTSDCALTPL